MLEYFTEDGFSVPATLVQAGPITVTQVKTTDSADGYNAVVVGYESAPEKALTRAEIGQTKDFGMFRYMKEFRIAEGMPEKGAVLDVTTFAKGDIVAVTGTSKGKGFQGVVKRHGFKGGRRSHGQKHSEREPGSIGGGLRTRVPKGMRMAGRMGTDRVTVRNLEIVAIDTENNILVIKGAIPGRRGTLLEIVQK